jgi:hypothetical protein
LDKAEELCRQPGGNISDSKESFNEVFNAWSELQAIHSKSHLDLDNIETIFGAIEMGRIIGKFGNRRPEKIESLRNSIVTLIYKTLEFSLPFPCRGRGIESPPPYDNFMELITKANEDRHPDSFHKYSFLTFNYDLALDYALHRHRMGAEYFLESPTNPNAIPLLKLHGSINWGICPNCNNIVPRKVSEAHFRFVEAGHDYFFDLGTTLQHSKHCETHPLNGPPILIPPTWNKTAYHPALTNVWKKAASELAEAENIYVIGYSLPETDSFFRFLFALGSESSTRIKRFRVINPDHTGEVEKRFRRLIGRGIENRFHFERADFEKGISFIYRELADAR